MSGARMWIAVALLCMCNSAPLAAQSADQTHYDELTTDRPDFTETPYVMRPGIVQLESGFALERSGKHGERVHTVTFPSALLRVGIGHRLEMRVGGDGFIWQPRSENPDVRSGVSDHELQFKGVVRYESARIPAISLIGGLSFPVGQRDVTSGGYDPELKLAWAKQLGGGFGLGGNLVIASVTDTDLRVVQRGWSASLSHALGAGFGGYWEFYGLSAEEAGGRGRTVVNAGVTHLAGKNVQVDVEAGRAVANREAGWFVAFGLAVRHDFRRPSRDQRGEGSNSATRAPDFVRVGGPGRPGI